MHDDEGPQGESWQSKKVMGKGFTYEPAKMETITEKSRGRELNFFCWFLPPHHMVVYTMAMSILPVEDMFQILHFGLWEPPYFPWLFCRGD